MIKESWIILTCSHVIHLNRPDNVEEKRNKTTLCYFSLEFLYEVLVLFASITINKCPFFVITTAICFDLRQSSLAYPDDCRRSNKLNTVIAMKKKETFVDYK